MLAASLWTRSLSPRQLERVEAETQVRDFPAGAYVCRKGEPVEHWVGVIDGLVKMTSVSPQGKTTTFVGVTSGGWFGEGSLLRDQTRRYDIEALRASRMALMPRATFEWLLDTDIGFNRFLLMQLNERLSQFIAMVEYQRLLGPDARVARSLAALFNPVLYPDQDPDLAGGSGLPLGRLAPAREPGAAGAREGAPAQGRIRPHPHPRPRRPSHLRLNRG